MENVNLPFEYLNLQIGYTLSELEPAFFSMAIDSIELMQNEDLGRNLDIQTLTRRFKSLQHYLEIYRSQSNGASRKLEAKKAIEACISCELKISAFFHIGFDNSQGQDGNSPAQSNQNRTQNAQIDASDSGNMVQKFPPIFAHHQAAEIYDHIISIAHDTDDFNTLRQFYCALTQQYLGDIKQSVYQCLRLNDGQIDPFFILGKTLGGIVFEPYFMSDHDRVVYFSSEIMPVFNNALINCSKIRPSISFFPTSFIFKNNKSISADAIRFYKNTSRHLKKMTNELLTSHRHNYAEKPTSFDGYIDATNQGVEIYGINLAELRPLHQPMLLMLVLENRPVSAEDFSILNEKWREGSYLKHDAKDRISAEVSKLSKDLGKILNIENYAALIKRSHGSDREARYALNWALIDSQFNPTFAYLANFLS